VVDRIMRALRLDTLVFREIAEDQNAMTEAAIIVVAVTLLSAIGSAIGNAIDGASAGSVIGGFFFDWLAWGILVGWVGWAVVTYFVGTALFQGRTDIPEMMRVLGYASAPRLLGIFGIIPCLGWIAALAGAFLSLLAGVVAIREAMEFDTGKAVITVLISWLVTLVVYLPIRLIFF
jgi:hypothetical protein